MRKRGRIRVLFICLMVVLAGAFFAPKLQADARPSKEVLNLDQIEQVFSKAIKDGKHTVTFTAPASYTAAQLQNALNNAGKANNRLLAGSVQFRKQTSSASTDAIYTIGLPDDIWMKIKRLKSEKAAVKAAADALKNRKYATNYYSDTSYYPVFVKMLQQHPEYNYNTAVWKNTNGAYGYQRGGSLTKKQQDAKIKAADKAAKAAVQKCVTSKMSAKQKAKAIHNYLIKNCTYHRQVASAPASLNQYHDAFTAYGALVDGSAVCQGYAAAFNLMAQKCGLASMAVCGTAGGVAHAWTYAKFGSRNRYIDCTWDDMDDGAKVSYEYFYATEEKMRRQHVWNALDFPAGDIKYAKYF